MKVFIENIGEIETFDLAVLGKGSEGEVYQYHDLALKVHYNKACSYMDESTAKKLSKIKTERFLMPQSLIYDKKKRFIGYTTTLLKKKDIEENRKLNKDELIKELFIISNDVINLTKNKVLLKDVSTIDNILFNGSINFIDPGIYSISNKNYEEILLNNKKEVGEALYLILLESSGFYNTYDKENKNIVNELDNNDIFGFFTKLKLSKIIRELVDKEYSVNNEDYINCLINILNKYKTFSNYKKNLLKDAFIFGTEDEFSSYYINKIKKKMEKRGK